MKVDIETHADAASLVDAFCGGMRADPLLSGSFSSSIGDRRPDHLEMPYRFRATVLLNEASYAGAPLRRQFDMPIGAEHVERWPRLFHATEDTLFQGPVATLAKRNADRMAEMLQERIARQGEGPQRCTQ